MPNPFLITGPAVLQISGGRTSGRLLKEVLDAHGGRLPPDVYATFENTGKEMPETLDFVRDMSGHWNVPITWLEYRYEPPTEEGAEGRHYYEVVNHNSASRNGEPYDQLIRARKMLPNPVTRFCSIELKIRTCYRWVRAELGWDEWDTIVGLRADEPRRVAKQKARNESNKDRFKAVMPLATAGITKRDVSQWWQQQPFNLALLDVDGSTPDGNCDNCFLKSFATLAGRARRAPDSFWWWINWEKTAPRLGTMRKPEAALFRKDRPSYAGILDFAQRQGDLLALMPDDALADCACTD